MGRVEGFTVPDVTAQSELINEAINKAGLEHNDIDYIEAHGTGTPLGDPVEIRALSEVFSGKRSRDLYIASVKSNIGHLESAAGISSLLKVVLSLQKKRLPCGLHADNLAKNLPLTDIPGCVLRETIDWKSDNKTRVAGISSFGGSGTIAHVIVEEAPILPEPKASEYTRPLHILPLSAKTEKALEAQIDNYLKHIEGKEGKEGKDEQDIADICYTAGVGRAHFACRAAVVGDDKESIIKQLKNKSFIQGKLKLSEQSQNSIFIHRPRLAIY